MATTTSSTPSKSADANAAAQPSASTSGGAAAKASAGFPRWILLLLLAVVLIGGGGGGYMLWRSHQAKSQPGHGSRAAAAAAAASAQPAAPDPTVDLPLDPFVVNLADPSGHGFARIGLTLRVAAPAAAAAKGEKKEGAAADADSPRDMVRDTIITVLNQEQASDLLAPGGKEHLKQAICAAVAKRDPQVKIVDIYFTEFLIQQ